MNLEGISLHILTEELKMQIVGGKIYKVFMPSKDSLLLLINKERETLALMADFSGDSPFFYLTTTIPERPDTPPAFCMLLRKHLEDGRISSINQDGLDRIITLEIDIIGAARQIVTKKLVFELTGKNSNVIFVENDVIIDALRHIGKNLNSFRQILPNLNYVTPPKQNGFPITTTSPLTIINAIQEDYNTPLLQALVAHTTGIGKFTATELLLASDIDLKATGLTLEGKNNLTTSLAQLQKIITEHSHQISQPLYGLISQQNTMKNIALFLSPQTKASQHQILEFQTINQALNHAKTLVPQQIPEKELLKKNLLSILNRTEKKVLALESDLLTAQDAQQQKIIADTLMANIYQIKKGVSFCEVTNIYDNTPLTINLSPLLTPIENAQAYYKRYNKFKRATIELAKQLTETKTYLEYLRSIDLSLQTATTKNEIAEIKTELMAENILPSSAKKKKSLNLPKSQPLILQISEETTIYIGKNNKQNDAVTFGIAKPKDLWFHTKNIPGSHVVLKTTLPTPRSTDISLAANLAAFFSKASTSSQVPVDYTEKRFVKKPAGAKPGFVIFTNQKTLYITPDETTIQKLLKN